MSNFPPASPPQLPGAPAPGLTIDYFPRPPRRRFSIGEILAWAVILTVVVFIAVRASMNQYKLAAAKEPDIMLPMTAQYATGVHALMAAGNPAGAAGIDRDLLTQLDDAARMPADKFRIAIVAGEFLGKEEALKRLAALKQADKALDEDIQTAETLYAGDSVPEATRAAFHDRYQWFSDLLMSNGKPAGDALRDATLQRAYVTVGVLICVMAAAGLLALAGLVLLIIALVRLARNKIKCAFPRGDAPGLAEPADRRTYIFGMAVYLGGFLGLGLLLRLASMKYQVPAWAGIFALAAPFSIGFVLPLFMGQSPAQWRLTLGLHTGRGVLREMGSGLLGYLAGMPLMAVGIVLVLILSKIAGIKGEHPIVEELQGPRIELVVVFFLACVFAPVTEEIMFRGALFAHLRERFGWAPSAIVMSLVFALIHPQSWVALPVLASIAIVFAGIREWRGSIIGSMTAHALHNGMALAVSVLMLR